MILGAEGAQFYLKKNVTEGARRRRVGGRLWYESDARKSFPIQYLYRKSRHYEIVSKCGINSYDNSIHTDLLS